MALQPGASLQSKWDQTRSYFQRREEFALTAATALTEEGQIVVRAGTSLTQVALPVGTTADLPVGVILLGEIDASTFTWVETFTIPAAATYTLKYVNLATNPYNVGALADASDIYIYDNTAVGAMTKVNPAPGDNQFSCVAATGIVTFNALDVGHSVTARYRWNLTTTQSREIVRQSAVGRGSENTYRKVVVGRGNNCRIYTTQYSPYAAWALNIQTNSTTVESASPGIGIDGLWTTTETIHGVGAVHCTPFGRVISLPSVNDPYLGIEYTTP